MRVERRREGSVPRELTNPGEGVNVMGGANKGTNARPGGKASAPKDFALR